MDAISAAGIGLGVASLVFQVFAGCIKGYQMLAEAEHMPVSYQHLRVRLRLEQSRLLHWGQKVGLLEERLDRPNQILHLNRTLVIDILIEVQGLFKDCMNVQNRFDRFASVKSIPLTSPQTFDRRFPRGTHTILTKTLAFIEKIPEAPKRLQWAMVSQANFETLIEKLAGYNTSIEMILDNAAVSELQKIQSQTLMVMLQLNSKVDELKELSLALKMPAQGRTRQELRGQSSSSAIFADQEENHASYSRLAEFKAQQISIEKIYEVNTRPLERQAVRMKSSTRTQAFSEAIYWGEEVWVEWKLLSQDSNHPQDWVEQRVQKLATLLALKDKPPEFRAPNCLGYFKDNTDDIQRYGFVFTKPVNTAPISLLNDIEFEEEPSLTDRIKLARALAKCLMYLHSVNWLHKGLRSNNVAFFCTEGIRDYSAPILTGFEYARPDYSSEETEAPPEHSEHDIYRHPSLLGNRRQRSQKSHDIYSLGILLVEVAYWQRIDEILAISKDKKAARREVKKTRDILLDTESSGYLRRVEQKAGRVYAEVTRKCLMGGEAIGSYDGADEAQGEIGAEIQRKFSEEVVDELDGMRL